MGILSRLKDLMKVNVGELLDRTEDPEKIVDEYVRTLRDNLGKIKAETASAVAEEERAKRALDECGAEISKLRRYAEKSAESHDEAGALRFLERKARLSEQLAEFQAAHDRASALASKMKQLQNKLAADLNKLEARREELKRKLAEARNLRQMNARASSVGADAAFKEMEEKADLALNEALALAELRGAGAEEDDLDALIAQLEKDMNGPQGSVPAASPNAADELAAIQADIQRKKS